MARPKIEHVVVLLLENRSFDHMLGFLDHDNPAFPKLTNHRIGKVSVSSTARYEIDSPDHSHNGVMSQIFGGEAFNDGWRWDYSKPYPTGGNNLGFIESYRLRCGGDRAKGERIMRCFHPKAIPVMATLAKQFAVFTHWYCSVPGETWPNRDFAVAARSFGKVNQYYYPRPKGSSIFEKLADAGGTFGIYHDSVAHTLLYPGLYRRNAFHGMQQFFADVEAENLPQYSYIEPDFGLGSTKWLLKQFMDTYGNSQHPGQAGGPAEFLAGEYLVARIYNALRATMDKHPGEEHKSLFAKTLFLITYDEHGGFFDREMPPRAPQPTKDDRTDAGFKFDILGPRVPAILISPWIEPGTIVDATFDHASIPATVRNLFAPNIPPLNQRDAAAARFHMVAIRADPTLRTKDLPEVEPLDLPGAAKVMQDHGAPAGVADQDAPDAQLAEDWKHVADTANKLLPPPPLGVTGPDIDKDPEAFAKDVVDRVHTEEAAPIPKVDKVSSPKGSPPPAAVARAPSPPKPAPPKVQQRTTRTLRAYAFDPSRGRVLGNSMSLQVPYHDLLPGPVEYERDLPSKMAVVDYDASSKSYYRPVDLNDPNILLSNGLWPSESDVHFHQQMLYAVARDTVAHFESAFGRRIHWRRASRQPGDPRGYVDDDIVTLGLHPHAMRAANAYYSPKAHGILFGYFPADRTSTVRSLPGQPIFTCLSHDIIVHELTHAILDGQRGHFLEQTNLDLAAFHEGFADLAALFRHFSHREVLLDTLQRTGGRLYNYQLRPNATTDAGASLETRGQRPVLASQIAEDNPLIGLAQQFGDATGKRGALRSALGTPPTPTAYKKVDDAHHRGSILVAAVFDAFFSIYVRRTSDLWAIYRAGGGSDRPVDLPAPLANQLCNVATATARQFFEICVRAIDYCPPIDLSFGEYLRALITAEIDRDPEDVIGIREALMQAFRLRGIYPDGARFFSEDALCWSRGAELDLPAMRGLSFDDPNRMTRDARDHVANRLEDYLALQKVRDALRFDRTIPTDLKSFHPVVRIIDGHLQRDLVVEVVQTKLLKFDDDPNTRYPFRAGATLIISNSGDVRWCVSKPMFDGKNVREAEERHLRQQAFLVQRGLKGDIEAAKLHVDFAGIHGGV